MGEEVKFITPNVYKDLSPEATRIEMKTEKSNWKFEDVQYNDTIADLFTGKIYKIEHGEVTDLQPFCRISHDSYKTLLTMFIKITYYFIFFLLIFHISSCQKELGQPTISFGKYILMDITCDEPVDLNDDGISNRDLKKELAIFNKTALYLYDGPHPSIDLIWPEIYLNNKPINRDLIELPDENVDIQYVTISLQYYISFSEEMKFMKLEQPLTHNQGIYSLVIPQIMNIDIKNNIIYFNSYHKFYINEEILTLPVTIKFSIKSI